MVNEVVGQVVADISKNDSGFQRRAELLRKDVVEKGQDKSQQNRVSKDDRENKAQRVLGKCVVDSMKQEVEEENELVIRQVIFRVEQEPVEEVLDERPQKDTKEDVPESGAHCQCVFEHEVNGPGKPENGNVIPRGLAKHFEEGCIKQNNISNGIDQMLWFSYVSDIFLFCDIHCKQLPQEALVIVEFGC